MERGLRPLTHTDELYFWLNTYAHGYVRRGLAGSLAAGLLGQRPAGTALQTTASLIHLGAVLASVALLATRLRPAPGRPAMRNLAVGVLFASSPFLGLLAHHTGYPDGLITLLLTAACIALPALGAAPLAALLVLACAFHELAFLLLLPIVLLHAVLRPGWPVRDWALLGAGILAACLLPGLARAPGPDLAGALAHAGLSPAVAQAQVSTSLVESTGAMLPRMLHLWAAFPANGAAGALYALLPALLITLLGLPQAWRRAGAAGAALGRWPVLALYLLACLGGASLLLLAWDLARIASFTTLASTLTVVCVTGSGGVAPASRSVAAGCFAAASIYAALPLANFYFDYGRPINLALTRSVCPPCAATGTALIDLFNRHRPREERDVLDTDPLYGNAPARE